MLTKSQNYGKKERLKRLFIFGNFILL